MRPPHLTLVGRSPEKIKITKLRDAKKFLSHALTELPEDEVLLKGQVRECMVSCESQLTSLMREA